MGARADCAASGHARPAHRREAHSDACPSQHVDEGIDAETMQTPAHEIVHAGLAHAQELRRPGLREPTARNEPLKSQHEFRPDAEMLRLHGGKPDVAEDVGRALGDLDRDRAS
jgi:hypothetical protein